MSRARADGWRLLEAVEILHAHTEGSLGSRLSLATQHLFHGSVFALDVFGHEGQHIVEHDIPFDARVGAIVRDHGAEILKRDHPTTPLLLHGFTKVHRLSDRTSASAFAETELHRVIYRSIDIRFQLIAPIRTAIGHGALSVSRDRREFSERDMALIARYVRHVDVAFATDRMIGDRRPTEEAEAAFAELVARRRITKREGDALLWMSEGKRNAEIAAARFCPT
jgi:hypothetical protein